MLVNALITTEHNNLRSLWWNLLLSISAIAIQYTCKPEKQISRWDNFMNIYQIFLKFASKKRIFYYLYTTIKLFCKKIRPTIPIFASKKICWDFWQWPKMTGVLGTNCLEMCGGERVKTLQEPWCGRSYFQTSSSSLYEWFQLRLSTCDTHLMQFTPSTPHNNNNNNNVNHHHHHHHHHGGHSRASHMDHHSTQFFMQTLSSFVHSPLHQNYYYYYDYDYYYVVLMVWSPQKWN